MNKEGYYPALRQTQGTVRTETPDWQPWGTYFLKSLSKQKQHLKGTIKRERIVLFYGINFKVFVKPTPMGF